MSSLTITFPRAPEYYAKLYVYFINRIRKNPNYLTKYKEYEKHHILPIKLGGGDNDNNLILLRPRDHYLAHQMLLLAFPKSIPLQQAFWCMSHTRDRDKISAMEYERLKSLCKEGLKTNKGKKFTKEHRDKIGNAHKGRKHTAKARKNMSEGSKGIKHTDETKEKCRLAAMKRNHKAAAANEKAKNKKWYYRFLGQGKIESRKFQFPPDEAEGWVKGKQPKRCNI